MVKLLECFEYQRSKPSGYCTEDALPPDSCVRPQERRQEICKS